MRVAPTGGRRRLYALADSVNVMFEGAYVVSRAVRDGTIVGALLRLLRSHLWLLFGQPVAADRTPAPGGSPH